MSVPAALSPSHYLADTSLALLELPNLSSQVQCRRLQPHGGRAVERRPKKRKSRIGVSSKLSKYGAFRAIFIRFRANIAQMLSKVRRFSVDLKWSLRNIFLCFRANAVT